MKIKEIRTLPEDEMTAEIEKARAKIFKVRFQAKGENVENPGSLKTLRRHVARLKTVQREREIARDGAFPPRPPRGGGAGSAAPAKATKGGEA